MPIAAVIDPDRTAFSCVVDRDPLLLAQCFIWVNCLTELQGVPPDHVFVHMTPLASPEFSAWLAARGVQQVPITPFDPRSPHCNKLQQLATFADSRFAQIVLMDCDTAWIGDQPLPRGRPLAAKIVDLANPAEDRLAALFKAAGSGAPSWVPVTVPRAAGKQMTDRNNCNGGVYIFDAQIVEALSHVWPKWSHWCLDQHEILGPDRVHADQLGLMLALHELGMAAELLPIEWNFPTHLPQSEIPDLAPQLLHFHDRLTPHFKLRPVGLSRPDAAIEALNEKIAGFLDMQLLNSVFWDLRYRLDPELGSGVGSRGDPLETKRRLLAGALAEFGSKSVIDVGCGDLETTRLLPLTRYLGLDASAEALALARSKRPEWRFEKLDPGAPIPEQAAATICIDVLIHQKQPAMFDELVRRLADSASERLIVGAYDEPPSHSSEIVAYHRPISEALRSLDVFASISTVGRYRDCCLVVADKRRASSRVNVTGESGSEAATPQTPVTE